MLLSMSPFHVVKKDIDEALESWWFQTKCSATWPPPFILISVWEYDKDHRFGAWPKFGAVLPAPANAAPDKSA